MCSTWPVVRSVLHGNSSVTKHDQWSYKSQRREWPCILPVHFLSHYWECNGIPQIVQRDPFSQEEDILFISNTGDWTDRDWTESKHSQHGVYQKGVHNHKEPPNSLWASRTKACKTRINCRKAVIKAIIACPRDVLFSSKHFPLKINCEESKSQIESHKWFQNTNQMKAKLSKPKFSPLVHYNKFTIQPVYPPHG